MVYCDPFLHIPFFPQQMFSRYHGEFFAVIQDWTKRSAAETAEAYGSRLFGYDFEALERAKWFDLFSDYIYLLKKTTISP